MKVVGRYFLVTIAWLLFSPYKLMAFPNIGVDAATLPKGIVLARERTFFTTYTKKFDEARNRYVDLKSGEFFETKWSLTEVGYGINNRLTVVGDLWYYDSKINSMGDVGSKKGIGDFYAFSKYKIYSSKEEPQTGASFLLGIRLPTGDKDEMQILRFGDGSTDLGIGFSATDKWKGLSNSIFGGIWINNKSHNAVDKRHEIEYRATSEYELGKFNLQMELKGLWFEGNKERLLEIAPSIQYTPVFPLVFQVSYKVPIEAKGYFKYDYQLCFGITFGFPLITD